MGTAFPGKNGAKERSNSQLSRGPPANLHYPLKKKLSSPRGKKELEKKESKRTKNPLEQKRREIG